MQVFNLYLRILKKHIPQLVIYIIIYLVVAIIMSSSIIQEIKAETDIFSRNKRDIAFFSAENTPLIDGLKHELEKVANFIDLPDETEALQDALFFRNVSYIVRIPEGFTERFMKGEDVRIEKTVVPLSFSSVYIDMSIDNYLNTARLYLNHYGDISQETLVEFLKSDLSAEAAVELKTTSRRPVSNIYANYFFNYMPYTLLAILILGMSSLLLIFFDVDLRRRNNCAPISTTSFNLQFMLANLLYTLITWLILVLCCILFNFRDSLNINTIYFIINSFVFAVCAFSIGFLTGNLIRSPNAVPAVANVVTFGMCCISGVFVPVELLGDSVIKMASFTPVYWYVKANNHIAGLTRFDFSSVSPVLSSILIQLGFALACFSVALVAGKKRMFQ